MSSDLVTVHHGDALDVLAGMDAASVDAVVCDPPYGLEFMGREWDAPWKYGFAETGYTDGKRMPRPNHASTRNPMCRTCRKHKRGTDRCYCATPDFDESPADSQRLYQAWCEQWAFECLRLLKPGGHLLAFGGSRTFHRLACAIEDAGFEIRDTISWLYGSGFPKSLDVSKAIDKAAGVEREIVGDSPSYARALKPGPSTYVGEFERVGPELVPVTAPATDDARRWQGWGTALKPAHEPLIVAVKPHAISDMLGGIGSHLDRLEGECRQRASGAANSSVPTGADSPEARADSAHASAATMRADGEAKPTPTGAAAASSAAMDTSWSALAGSTCSNIVTSWKRCLAELSELTSTCTTSTATGPTTDLRTLWSSLSRLTAANIPESRNQADGLSSLAVAVDCLFAAALLSWRATLGLSAHESATGDTPTSRRGATGADLTSQHILVARKPLAGTVAGNVQTHGTGALNIDGCRVESADPVPAFDRDAGVRSREEYRTGTSARNGEVTAAGRWPTNVVLDEAAAAELDQQSGDVRSSGVYQRGHVDSDGPAAINIDRHGYSSGLYADTGGASRFFPVFRYEAKASADERPRVNGTAHPTVKPLDLMRWLVRLVTPPGGVVLDPFAGSGTTGEAAAIEGFRAVLIEREADYLPLIEARLAKPLQSVLPLEVPA